MNPMNPMVGTALGAIFRWGLAILSGYFVKAGIWNANDAETYVVAASMALAALAWSLWNKYKGRLKFLTALTMPQDSTEHEVEQVIAKANVLPSVTTQKTDVPQTPAIAAKDL